MHKFCKLLLMSIIISSTLFSVEKNETSMEVQSVENLILIGKQNIKLQEEIRLQLIQYQKINKAFIKNPDDNDLLFQTIKYADLLLENIRQAHLTQNFSAEFIKELNLFAKLAKKQGIPKP